jgi:hypothetical protein
VAVAAGAGLSDVHSHIYDRGVTDHGVIGKTGRVTGTVSPDTVGEVMVAVRGGSEAFYAHPAVPGEQISVGERVVVIDHEPPRTVYVSRLIA